jgi:hypothetical protein
MVLVKASEESEAGQYGKPEDFAAMGRFNEELVKAGVMLAGDGLSPTREGKRVRFEGSSKTTVLDGPFAETKELVAGYWIWEVASLEEAVEWLKRAPFQDTEVEIRRIHSEEDFADLMTPEDLDAEKALREQLESRDR